MQSPAMHIHRAGHIITNHTLKTHLTITQNYTININHSTTNLNPQH